MKIIDRFVIGVGFFFGLFVVHQLVGRFVSIHKWPEMTAADWGTWVGSIGTVLTLVGTIWIATDNERTRRNEARDRAFVAAAALLLRLGKMKDVLIGAAEHFSDEIAERNGFLYEAQASLIERIGTWTDEQILPLIVVPNHVCARLARVRPEIEDLIAGLADEQTILHYSWIEEKRTERDRAFLGKLIYCRDTVSFCLDECEKFTREVQRHRRTLQ